MIFLKERKNYWNDYFCNKFNGYAAFNYLGAYAMLAVIASQKKVTILEVGGGTGGATEKLINEIQNNGLLNNLSSYTFSDISPLFLKQGNKVLAGAMMRDEQCNLVKIDLNCSFLSQNVAKESFDVVYGVNSIHIAKNLLKTLKYIHDVLKPNGNLIICEHVRSSQAAPLYMEMIFNVLDSYTNVELDVNYRHSHGFLTINNWFNALEDAGFDDIEFIDDSFGEKGWNRDKMAMVIKGRKS